MRSIVPIAATVAALLFTVEAATAENLRVKLENNTEFMIVQFYATPTAGKGKRLELLNRHGLAAGQSRALTIAAGPDVCDFRVRAVFEDGAGYYDVGDTIDFCETDTFQVGD